ncbi:MAG TPA: histidine phosphatase family protein [Solirubrobacteraceae bacterium]|nr:histidine phosphatase family protein [Solirubrobacteraceae bacterium]
MQDGPERESAISVRRLLLVRHAPTAATGRRFAADEPIREPATVAGVLAGRLPGDGEVVSSPKLRCRQTAEAAGCRPAIEPRLCEYDFGRWEGIAYDALDAGEHRSWLADPDAAPHGGESQRAFSARVVAWLEDIDAAGRRPLVAFTHAGVIRAALVHVLGASWDAFWRLSVAPLSIVELGRCPDGWSVTL